MAPQEWLRELLLPPGLLRARKLLGLPAVTMMKVGGVRSEAKRQKGGKAKRQKGEKAKRQKGKKAKRKKGKKRYYDVAERQRKRKQYDKKRR